MTEKSSDQLSETSDFDVNVRVAVTTIAKSGTETPEPPRNRDDLSEERLPEGFRGGAPA